MSNALTAAGGFSIDGMQGAMQLAKAMSAAKMVPQHLQGSPGDCLMVIEQAMRWQMSPFAVAQATAVVRGKMTFEGKLIAAAVQTSGVLEGRLNYEFAGSGDNRKITVIGHIRGEKSPRTVDVVLKDAKTDNQWWTKTPDQMLSYHGARVWARRHVPEVMLGVYAPEEFDSAPPHHETVDVTPAQTRTIQQDRPVDHLAVWTTRLESCRDAECCDRQYALWDETIQKAEAAGRPIASDVAQAVFDMIADKRGSFPQTVVHDDLAEIPA
ncbi:hypothetical protein GOB93_14125 [Acetobacter musti]|uniref:Recombinase RecT n=1 Tax=Acetobacter musti TaxID=864732 RepID=A0ABX0JRY0_9PROT|nr:recombinase RecT [Acetobacter musti]NHN85770.1 hypothetical protein [Acetobacter musti]